MKHIYSDRVSELKTIEESVNETVCGAFDADHDVVVDAALESDCEPCRSHPSVMVGPPGQKGCAVLPTFVSYKPQPMNVPEHETLEALRARRDGR